MLTRDCWGVAGKPLTSVPDWALVRDLEFDTYDTQVLDSYRTSIKIADYK